MSVPILEARALAKVFDLTPVFFGVELSLGPGQGVSIVGANGAGKSTLIKTLAGLLAPTTGRVALFGRDSARLTSAERRRIGVLTHQSMLYPNLSASENLEFYARLYGLPHPQARAAQWLARLGLAAAAATRVHALSRGMEQRLALARTILAEPDLMLLDEPFTALDDEGVALVAGLLKAAVLAQRTLVVTAHAAAELDDLRLETRALVGGRLLAPCERERPGRLRSSSVG